MSKKSYNNFGVPHFATPETPAIRPKAPREMPEDLLDEKCRRGRALQYIYTHIRDNWAEGDELVMTGLRRRADGKDTVSRFAGKSGRFVGKRDCGSYTMISVEWNAGGRGLLGPAEFYWHAYKPDEVEVLPEVAG